MDGWIVVSIVVVGLGVIVARHMDLKSLLNGRRGEFLIRQALRSRLPEHEYRILDDVKLRYRDAEVQVDHIVVSRHGVFLLENLHNAGEVEASPSATHWQCRRGGVQLKVVNPLRKHAVHLKVLCDRLELSPTLFDTLLVCTGSTRFKGQRPQGVLRIGGLLPFIQIRNKIVLDHDEVYALAENIESLAEPRPEPILPVPRSWADAIRQASERLGSVRRFLHVGIDHRHPTAGMVRTATGFVFSMLLLTLALDAVGPSSGDRSQTVMGSMEASASISPFADAVAGPVDLAAPALSNGKSQAQVEAERRALVQQELDRQLAWEASLTCAVNEANGQCSCRDPLGDLAPLSAEHCEFLVVSAGSDLP